MVRFFWYPITLLSITVTLLFFSRSLILYFDITGKLSIFLFFLPIPLAYHFTSSLAYLRNNLLEKYMLFGAISGGFFGAVVMGFWGLIAEGNIFESLCIGSLIFMILGNSLSILMFNHLRMDRSNRRLTSILLPMGYVCTGPIVMSIMEGSKAIKGILNTIEFCLSHFCIFNIEPSRSAIGFGLIFGCLFLEFSILFVSCGIEYFEDSKKRDLKD